MTACRRYRLSIIAFLCGLLLAVASVPAYAQSLPAMANDAEGLSEQAVQLFMLISVLSLAPAIGIMITCFPFVITVLAILRQAIGLQQSPPNMLLVSLALFLTYFVMDPVFSAAWVNGVSPYLDQQIELQVAWERTVAPFRDFMASRVDPETVEQLASLRPETIVPQALRDLELSLLVPSFMLSEISQAFQVGFLIFLPFLIIDLVVAAILMSMGMMMVPPAIVSLPFKLAFFVVADGWTMISHALVGSYI